MVEHILDLDYSHNENLEKLFRVISQGNGILFLGAGASVTKEKRFLSKDLIEFFEDKKNISWGIDDIMEFVDALSSNKNFSRDEFDNYVDECLRKLEVNSAHRTIAKNSWRLIITTNYDLLIEKAFNELEDTADEVCKIKPVHNTSQYYSIQARNEIKYVKLHGCISNKRQYKLIFSTDDFNKVKKFYKSVLDDLKNLSDNVAFLSAGYSYSDAFAKKLLEKIDSYNFREKRVIYNIDPYVNDAMLSNYSQKNICIIKSTIEDFFKAYNDWLKEREVVVKVAMNNNFKSKDNEDLFIPFELRKRIGFNVKQLNIFFNSKLIADNEFYKGGEPDYNVILKNYDVKKEGKLTEVKEKIKDQIYDENSKSRLIPIFFLTGTFGTGKSTFAYRLINYFNQSDLAVISFEIYDPFEIRPLDLKEIVSKSGANIVLFYLNAIEVNSVFKSLLELRNKLSIEMGPERKVFFLTTIRENILLKYKEGREIKNSFEINVDCPFNRDEIGELVDKLKNSGVISYRDIRERQIVENKIIKEFQGDSFVSLLELVQGNQLVEDLLQAYHQLNSKCKKAFLYTSLLYQYKLLMPSGTLQSLVSTDWDDFRSEVVQKDGKGILIQEIVDSKGTEPDLYFRTKHPLISRTLIKSLLGTEDERFDHIKSIMTHIILGQKSTRLVVDFLKAIITYKDLPMNKVDHLYDLADEHLSEDPLFLLHYAINLQHRQSEESIIKAISKIRYAESISEKPYRNHILVHRRGVLCFELAKFYYKRKDSNIFYKVVRHLEEAKDFLEIKRSLDPFSSYSYTDLLNMELWCLEKLEEDTNVKLKRRIFVEELLDVALRTVFENSNRIYEIKNRFIQYFKFNENESEYLAFLNDYYGDSASRPYALILLFNHFFNKMDFDACQKYLVELENLTLNKDVLNLLFKYYGRNLYDMNVRMKFFDLIRSNPELEEQERLRFYYFNFIAECYNKNFSVAFGILNNIKERFNHINPDFHQIWLDSESSDPKLFEATLRYNKYRKLQFYIPDLNIWVRADNWRKDWIAGMSFDLELHFYVYGLRGKAINVISEDFEEDSYSNELSSDLGEQD